MSGARRAVSEFRVTGWDQALPYDEGPPALARATVTKAFTGAFEGTSSAELLLCGGDDLAAGAGYIAQERVTGTLDGRSGTLVLNHGGITGGGEEPTVYGYVVPGSGTGDLAGITGRATFQHDEHGAIFTLEYDLP